MADFLKRSRDPAPTEPGASAAARAPGFFERRRRRARLRKRLALREEMLLELGALVFELHRQGQRAPELLQARAAELDAVDHELRAMEYALDEDDPSAWPAPAAASAWEQTGEWDAPAADDGTQQTGEWDDGTQQTGAWDGEQWDETGEWEPGEWSETGEWPETGEWVESADEQLGETQEWSLDDAPGTDDAQQAQPPENDPAEPEERR